MYKIFTSSCRLQLHLVKVVVRISMHAYVSLAQSRSCIIPQGQGITTQIAICTRTVDSTWHIMSLTAATTSATSLAWSFATITYNISQTVRSSGTGVKRRWWKPVLHVPSELGDVQNVRTLPIGCFPQRHLQVNSFMWSSRFAYVGGNAIIRSSFPFFRV